MVFEIKSKITQSKAFWLHQNGLKFWEMLYDPSNNQTTIRCGKVLELEPDLIEEPDNQVSSKTHASYDDSIKYIEKHVNTKIGRGYEFLKKDNKRKGSDLSADEGSIQKKVQTGQNQGVPMIVVNQPAYQGGQKQQQKNQQKQQQNLLSVNNNNNSDDYSETSKKPSLSYLTDISQQQVKVPSLNGQKIDLSGLGTPSNGPENVLLAKKWEKDIDPTGWYMSEKLDGLRGFWSGSNLYSRNKNRFWAPDFFVKNWPNCEMDGELWTKRDDFAKAVSIVKSQKSSVPEDWKQIRYVVYDIPGLNKPFKQRVKAMQEILAKVDNPYIIVHPQVLCENQEHLEEELASILEKGGEGVMIRDPNSFYERTRSNTLLKVKVMHDEEATIIGFEASKTRPNLMGAMICKNQDGIEFKVGQGLTDAQRAKPPKKGTVITYKYQNKQPSGKPRFPIFVRVKEDAGL